MHQENFLHAMKTNRKMRVTFYSQQENKSLTRILAPKEFSPSRYHFWDYESENGPQSLQLIPKFVLALVVLNESAELEVQKA